MQVLVWDFTLDSMVKYIKKGVFIVIKISKLGKLSKKGYIIKYSNWDFDEIFKIMITNLDFNYIKLQIWSKELYLFCDIEYALLCSDSKFTFIEINKSNSIKILKPSVYEQLRFFEIKIFNNEQNLFTISYDNYGEYTSIAASEKIDDKMHKLNNKD